jgi:hypothetical protein
MIRVTRLSVHIRLYYSCWSCHAKARTAIFAIVTWFPNPTSSRDRVAQLWNLHDGSRNGSSTFGQRRETHLHRYLGHSVSFPNEVVGPAAALDRANNANGSGQLRFARDIFANEEIPRDRGLNVFGARSSSWREAKSRLIIESRDTVRDSFYTIRHGSFRHRPCAKIREYRIRASCLVDWDDDSMCEIVEPVRYFSTIFHLFLQSRHSY